MGKSKSGRFHITEDGPKPCEASVKNCPVGGEHYADVKEAQAAFEKSEGGAALQSVQHRRSTKFDVHSPEMSRLLSVAPSYRKSAVVEMRVAEPGEKLETVLADGTVETTRVLSGGEAIVRNPLGEEYAMSSEKFSQRYEDVGGVWRARGVVKAVRNPTGCAVTIMAPWGEEQYGDAECYIAVDPQNDADRYIIGAAEFASTYAPVTGGEMKSEGGDVHPVSSPQEVIHGVVKPLKGGSYYGVDVPSEQLSGFAERFRSEVGEENFSEYVDAKQVRDGGDVHHVTVITPPELRKLRKQGVKVSPPGSVTVEPVGVGHVADDGGNEAWFVVCRSLEVQKWRKKMGLPPHDLHVTLGFKGKDVHGVSKGVDTLI